MSTQDDKHLVLGLLLFSIPSPRSGWLWPSDHAASSVPPRPSRPQHTPAPQHAASAGHPAQLPSPTSSARLRGIPPGNPVPLWTDGAPRGPAGLHGPDAGTRRNHASPPTCGIHSPRLPSSAAALHSLCTRLSDGIGESKTIRAVHFFLAHIRHVLCSVQIS